MKVGDEFPNLSLRHIYAYGVPFEASGKEPRQDVHEILKKGYTLLSFFPELKTQEAKERLAELDELKSEFAELGVTTIKACGYNQVSQVWSDCLALKYPENFYAFLGYDFHAIDEVSRGTMPSYVNLFLGPDCKLIAKFFSSESAKTIWEKVRELMGAHQTPPAEPSQPTSVPATASKIFEAESSQAESLDSPAKAQTLLPEQTEERGNDSDLDLTLSTASEGEASAISDYGDALQGDGLNSSAAVAGSSTLALETSESGEEEGE